MQVILYRKPQSFEEVVHPHEEHTPVDIELGGVVGLSEAEYDALTADLHADRDYLDPYAFQSFFTDPGHARGVIITAPGRRKLAAVLEGHRYPRYIGIL